MAPRRYWPEANTALIIAQVHNMDAVVNPFTLSKDWSLMITPAPKKPRLVISPCSTLASTRTECCGSYTDIKITEAEPIDTRENVRIPAALCRFTRFHPNARPTMLAKKILRSISLIFSMRHSCHQ